MSAVYGAADCVFQSTPPRGWRRKPTSAFCEGEQFQSTPPRGWRLTVWISPNSSRLFQSTPPRGWRPRPFPLPRHLRKFQSTPPRGWRLLPSHPLSLHLPISIHSTTRVETLHPERLECLCGISIHSTTRVETAILHNNHYYSSTHFHKQIISHPLKSRPTIPAHSQIRSHCANFPVRISP